MHFENILVKNLFKSYFVKRKDRSVSFHFGNIGRNKRVRVIRITGNIVFLS